MCVSSEVASDKDAGRKRKGSYTGTGSLQGPWGFLLQTPVLQSSSPAFSLQKVGLFNHGWQEGYDQCPRGGQGGPCGSSQSGGPSGACFLGSFPQGFSMKTQLSVQKTLCYLWRLLPRTTVKRSRILSGTAARSNGLWLLCHLGLRSDYILRQKNMSSASK